MHLSRGREYGEMILLDESFLNHGITSTLVRKMMCLWWMEKRHVKKRRGRMALGIQKIFLVFNKLFLVFKKCYWYSKMVLGIQKLFLVFKKWFLVFKTSSWYSKQFLVFNKSSWYSKEINIIIILPAGHNNNDDDDNLRGVRKGRIWLISWTLSKFNNM